MPSFRLKRGNSAQVAAYSGSAGELIYNTETGNIVVMDGATLGGNSVGSGGASIQSTQSGISLTSDGAHTTFPALIPGNWAPMAGENFAQNSTRIFFPNNVAPTGGEVFGITHSDFANSSTNFFNAIQSSNTVSFVLSNYWYSPQNSYNLTSIAANDTFLLMGDGSNNNSTGTAVLVNISTGFFSTLTPPAGSTPFFGETVAINDSYAYVSSADFSNPGEIHIYELPTGSYVRTISLASAGTSFAGYDASASAAAFSNVAANNNHLIVGHDSYPNGPTDNGGVFVFNIDGSTFRGYVPNPSTTGNPNAFFLATSKIFGINYPDIAVLTHPYWDINSVYSGALVFLNCSTLQATVSTNPNPNTYNSLASGFGNFVSVYNDTSENKDYFYSVDTIYTTPNQTFNSPHDGLSFIYEYDHLGNLNRTISSADSFGPSIAPNNNQFFVNPDPFYIVGNDIVLFRSDFTNYYQGFGTISPALTHSIVEGSTNLSFPTNVSDLSNDSGFVTSADIPSNLSSFTDDVGYRSAGIYAINLNPITNTGSTISQYSPVFRTTPAGFPVLAIEAGSGANIVEGNFIGFASVEIAYNAVGKIFAEGDLFSITPTSALWVSGTTKFEPGLPAYLTSAGTVTLVAADGFLIGVAVSTDTMIIGKATPPTRGGTGLTSIGSAGDLLIVNSSGDGYEFINELDLGTLP